MEQSLRAKWDLPRRPVLSPLRLLTWEWALAPPKLRRTERSKQHKTAQLAHMQQQGKAPVDWMGKAAPVQTVAWPEGDSAWNTEGTAMLGTKAPAPASLSGE